MIEQYPCPRCGHEHTITQQEVTEFVNAGNRIVEVLVKAGVCSFCGERWFDPQAQNTLDQAFLQLKAGDLSHFALIGELYRAQSA